MRELTGPPPPEPVRAVRADALERADRAWTARVTGSTWREAAEIGGYSSDKHAMNAARRVYGELPRIDRDELRRLWRDRLESAWRQCASDMADRVPGATTAAVRRRGEEHRRTGTGRSHRGPDAPTRDPVAAGDGRHRDPDLVGPTAPGGPGQAGRDEATCPALRPRKRPKLAVSPTSGSTCSPAGTASSTPWSLTAGTWSGMAWTACPRGPRS
jgi:hypothetical protein